MEPLVDTLIEDPRWEGFGLAALATRACDAALRELGVPVQGFTLCLMGCDDAHIATLNADFRGKPTPTNVLSWPSEERAAEYAGEVPDLPDAGPADNPENLGDIAIAWETCMAEAEAATKPMADHVTHLVIHGLLHLLGYDHIDDIDATLMETTEARILETLGLANPYDN
ncbi:rRNA maturation RNase YbeY [Pseudorhodobacter turbinis]|uniref:Endoribonuclease YbeY n=1 Tax=Pseudorhodobacter turbinis TaxID=2500533 RepID=A0A4P8EHD5_9RHOB|nr:rRNA maturation RNase YbeY [Pseudorhodobacter turbinis]QCO56580.1 rRNA maturation RNase YbeY [Pseudorhodobacter turbinis]